MNTQVNIDHQRTFLDEYQLSIEPKLYEIDIFIKSRPERLAIKTVSKLLYISEKEVSRIIKENDITQLNTATFFIIMKNGSSDICSFFRRELERGTPSIYLPNDISYIYNIDIDIILDACKNLGIWEYTSSSLKYLFSNITL